MLSPKKQEYQYHMKDKSRNTSRYNPTCDIISPKEKTIKINKGDFIGYHEYDKESLASTHDSSQRNKLYNTSYSDTNILKYRKYQEYKDYVPYSDRDGNQRMKLSNSNNSLLQSSKKDPIWIEANTPREKRNIQTYQDSYLRNSRQWNFTKKPSLKGVQKPKIDDSRILKVYQKSEKDRIISQASSNRQSRDISYTSTKKQSPYEHLSKSNNIPMFIQRKESMRQNQDLSESNILNKSKSQKKYQEISIHDFEIGKSCGKGMYGNVYAARLKNNGTLYALKKISKQIVVKNKMQQQLTLEIKLQMFFDHPNILKLYHFFEDQKHIYLVMQYMQEGSLFEKMQKRNEKMNEKETALIIIQIANALNYLHDRDVVHRDIKPQNIVISNGVYKLCDFGWATVCTDRRSTYCGTFDYAAPQILEGKQYDAKVDLWCLGVLTFQLLTRKVPFYDASRKQSIRKIVNSDKQGPIFPNNISTKCRHFIQNLMRKRPQERLTAEDLYSHPYLALYLPKQKFFY